MIYKIEYEEGVSGKKELVTINDKKMLKVPKVKGSHSHHFDNNSNYCFYEDVKNNILTISSLSFDQDYNYKIIEKDLETTTHIFVSKSI